MALGRKGSVVHGAGLRGFRYGYTMDEGDTYPGERAWVADREGWPDDAPVWIASGDLQPAE